MNCSEQHCKSGWFHSSSLEIDSLYFILFIFIFTLFLKIEIKIM